MHDLRALMGLAAALAPLAGCPSQEQLHKAIDTARHQEIAVAEQRVYPTLVFVKPIRETFTGGERQRAEVFGSGVIIDPQGYVVTNHHVAQDAVEVHCVLWDKEQVPAAVVGLDPETDLALLKLELPDDYDALPVAEFADSDRVRAGQTVMALGAPFGFTRSISRGIVSNTKRYLGFTSQHRYNLWFQTDAAINPGNSGGPLVDTDGRIVGISTLGTWAEGIGFAIPANVVKSVVGRLRAAAAETPESDRPVKVHRTYTGLQLQALRDFNSNTFTDSQRGVLVRSVDPDSPAAACGVQGGDILLRVAGRQVDGMFVEGLPPIRVLLSELPEGEPVELLVAREDVPSNRAVEMPALAGKLGGRRVARLELTSVPRGKFEGDDFDCRRWNMTVKEITKFSNPRLHFLHPSDGVYIQGVRGEGNASDAGLCTDDILLNIGEQEITTLADVRRAYRKLVEQEQAADKKALVTVQRGAFRQWKMLKWTRDYLKED